jgi:hypothetical protein
LYLPILDPMIHTYGRTRRSSWSESGLLRTLAKIAMYAPAAFFVTLLVLVLVGIVWLLWSRPSDWGSGVFVLGGWLIGLRLAVYWHSTECKEIRLGDDGICEFETRRRVVRTHVAQIASVKEEVDEDGDRNYFLWFRDRGRLWTCGLADFEDFLTRIEAMNPSIEIKRHKPFRLRRR